MSFVYSTFIARGEVKNWQLFEAKMIYTIEKLQQRIVSMKYNIIYHSKSLFLSHNNKPSANIFANKATDEKTICTPTTWVATFLPAQCANDEGK